MARRTTRGEERRGTGPRSAGARPARGGGVRATRAQVSRPDHRPSELTDASRGERLQRVLADAGVASRRECEGMIEAGRVRVNGRTVTQLPVWVDTGSDVVEVDGRRVGAQARKVYVMLNKPARMVVTERDEPGAVRRTIAGIVDHPLAPRLFPVGRLDFETMGLLLLTNDGDLTHALTSRTSALDQVFVAVVRGGMDADALESLASALTGRRVRRATGPAGARDSARPARDGLAARSPVGTGGGRPGTQRRADALASADGREISNVRVRSASASRTELELTVPGGRRVDLHDVLGGLGHPIRDMERIGIGPIALKGVARGAWRELTAGELRALLAAIRRAGRAREGDARARR